MSSDDSEFDKEAERERLREKYEQDEKDRENTQRMSELLLQGATMTGKHCSACGDPIFRYDGQEFCPTCQREVGGEEAERTTDRNAADADQGSAQAEGADESGSDRAADRTSDSGDEPRVEINDVRVADQHADRGRRTPPSRQDRSGEHRDAGQQDAGRRDAASSGLGEARSSLVRTLNDLARRAEATDDVSRRRELLAATREAAEALAALDRANR